jgi:prepilin-type N-terminal cleavage/methylation domain-containing protein
MPGVMARHQQATARARDRGGREGGRPDCGPRGSGLSRGRRDESGLTLIELVVTLMIIGMLAFATYVLAGKALQIITSKGAVEQVASAIRDARQQAITTGQNYCIQFSGTPETRYAIKTASDGSTCDGTGPVFGDSIGNGAVVTTPANLTVIFDSTGVVTNYPQPTAACPPVTTGATKCPFVVQVGVDTQPASCPSTVGVTISGGVRTNKC